MILRLHLLSLLVLAPCLRADDSTASRVAAPAFLEAVTFNVDSEGDKRVLTVVSAPDLVRIDVPTDRMSLIYNPKTEHYIGLEHSNYTWWDFSWPEVRNAVQGSNRYAARLRDLGPDLLEENNESPSANAPAETGTTTNALADTTTPPETTTAGEDTSGYVWRPTNDRKRIAGFDCVHWIGETVAGEPIDAWCTPGLQAPIERAVAILRAVNEPMALVPVRNFMPPLAFVAWDALTKGGVTPVLMTWGIGQEHNRVALLNVKQRDGKLSYFEIPKIYMKTTLVTMDGIGGQLPPGVRPGQLPLKPRHGADLPSP